MLFHSLECSSPTPNCHTNSNSFFERQLKLCFFGVALPDCLQRGGRCLPPGNTSIATIPQLASRTPHKLKARASTSSLHSPTVLQRGSNPADTVLGYPGIFPISPVQLYSKHVSFIHVHLSAHSTDLGQTGAGPQADGCHHAFGE